MQYKMKKSKFPLDKSINSDIIITVTITVIDLGGDPVTKYSRQRQTILEVLKSVTCHPTAAWIYERVRQEIPNISLGTVYRNLSLLKASGDIISFTPEDGVERFDGDIRPHFHLMCRSCGQVADIPEIEMQGVERQAEQLSGCEITGYDVMFYGLCKHCKVKINDGTAEKNGGNLS